jgi:hypothetical protein
VLAFLYICYLGIQGIFGSLSNIAKKSIRNIYNIIEKPDFSTFEYDPAKFIKIKIEHV